MFTKLFEKMVVCALLWGLLTSASTGATDANSSVKGHRPGHVEKMILSRLGLKEDVNDTEIIKLLDISDKTGSVILLIRYRKITKATPKLLQIVDDDNIIIFKRLAAAKALCDFGNKEWMQTIKLLLTDPNTLRIPLHAPLRIDIAGLLARAGDYSQFKIVASHIHHSKRSVRQGAIQALRNFGHKTNPVTDSAVELLTSAAISDPIPFLRERAIESLEKIAKKKPEVTSKVIDALDANIDSPDKKLRSICRAKLTIYGRKLKTD